ncbi:MAG: hypothetical protein GWM90_08525 [Gemmatimonadetes bacterium]|nr:hypothetical protein [Gemmatimonadota bacterium]NIQ53917.1 hypothetical protein [Gemmatimonadota bacterium]NIU74093.1 hypothetical protein [Gammaproteobacteria bacterium]NIX44155.1 hypothetical protein [Gemmatimonadota bacterium]NIY08379.1 hypothetical protein [Gemmatimonadota bacterium]
MAVTATAPQRSWLGPIYPSELGLVGQVATSWAVAGGLLAALVVTGHVLAGALSSSLGFLTTSIFFVAGAVVAFLHGAILAYVGRPPDVDRRMALHRLALAVVYAFPAIALGWILSMMLSLSAASYVSGRTLALAASILAWVAAAGVFVWAVVETRGAVRNLCRRWPGAQAVLAAMTLAFLAALPVFLVTRPEMWVVGVRPSATAAGFMALAATLWIGGPLGALALLAMRAWTRHHPGDTPEREAADGMR